MTAGLQLLGLVAVTAGLVVLTGSVWPVIAAGALLMLAPELPGLRAMAKRRRELRQVKAKFRAESATGRGRGPMVIQ